jgi:flagellar basal-body rod protein FlgB
VTGLFDRSVGALVRGLDFASRRHEVLSQNIANAATPGYRARDVVFDDVLRVAAPPLPGQPASAAAGDADFRVVYADDGPAAVDGNDVHGERQMARLAENLLYHSALVATLTNRFAAVKQAIAGRV